MVATKTTIRSADDSLNLETCSYTTSSSPSNKLEVIFITGWNESYIKYEELYADFNARGHTVHTYDHRSQGFSGRSAAAGSPDMSYVNSFEDYIDDFFHFVESLSSSSKFILVGHSMGGMIALNVAARQPHLFTSVTANAPMICFKTDGWPWPVAGFLGKFFCSVGLGSQFAIGSPQPHWEPTSLNFGQQTTHSVARLSKYLAQRKQHPCVCLAGPSFKWILEVSARSELHPLLN